MFGKSETKLELELSLMGKTFCMKRRQMNLSLVIRDTYIVDFGFPKANLPLGGILCWIILPLEPPILFEQSIKPIINFTSIIK